MMLECVMAGLGLEVHWQVKWYCAEVQSWVSWLGGWVMSSGVWVLVLVVPILDTVPVIRLLF